MSHVSYFPVISQIRRCVTHAVCHRSANPGFREQDVRRHVNHIIREAAGGVDGQRVMRRSTRGGKDSRCAHFIESAQTYHGTLPYVTGEHVALYRCVLCVSLTCGVYVRVPVCLCACASLCACVCVNVCVCAVVWQPTTQGPGDPVWDNKLPKSTVYMIWLNSASGASKLAPIYTHQF